MKNKIRVIVALVCALAVIGTGTFAWGQIISEKNEFWGKQKNSTLHDDFDPGTGQKDVYVENTGNVTLYVRVKLDEAMNIGDHEWRPSLGSHWATHTYESGACEECGNTSHQGKAFHDYFTWSMGGQKWYMPAAGTSGSVINDTHIYNSGTPGAKQTPYAQIITTAQFVAMSEQQQDEFIGWIYSTDGYAYWSQPVLPGEATGLLLHHVATSPALSNESYYYVINVIAEVADRADAEEVWINGNESVDGSPRQPEETSGDGKDTIWIIIGKDGGDDGDTNNDPSLAINGKDTIAVGEDAQLTYTLKPADFDFDESSDVHWSTSDDSIVYIAEDGMITGIGEGTATITLTIGEGDDAITATIVITVTDGTTPPTTEPPGTDLPVNAGPFTPLAGDGYYAKHDFTDPTDSENNHIYRFGSIHLEDIISDGNYNDVTATAASPYASFITVNNDQHSKPSIIYSYFPTNQQWIDQLGNGDMLIPVQVTLTRGEQSATITINMIYPNCVVNLDV